MHAAADSVGRLEDRGRDAGVPQREGGVQAGDAAAHDRDPPLAWGQLDGGGEGGARHERGARGDTGRLQEVAAREPGAALGANGLDRAA